MESGNRNVWIIVFVVVVLLCLCALTVAVIAGGVFWFLPIERGVGPALERERLERSFEVGNAPTLQVDNFAGSVTVVAGDSGVIRVVATKKGAGMADLSRVEIEMSERDGGVVIATRKPAVLGNASVELEISAPFDTQSDLRTGAGSIDVRGFQNTVDVDTGAGSVTVVDVTAALAVHTGAGSIDVRGGAGPVRLDTGAGSIDYQGAPQGECRFESGTGSITLRLPADLSMEIDLETGIGDVDVDYDVVGEVSRQEVRGVIGAGNLGEIYAHTGTGSIDVRRQ